MTIRRPRAVVAALATAALLAAGAAGAAGAPAGPTAAGAPGAAGTTTGRTAVERPSLSDAEATAIAETSGKLQDWIEDREISRTAVELDQATGVHTVFFVSEDDEGEETVEAQVLVDDDSGEITEVRTGPQVSWMMARGYEGTFGRGLNEPTVWIALCVLFLVPMLARSPRRWVSWRTLDLLALLSFSISLIWFNRGEIFTSVPLQYPPMVYLALRLTWIAFARARSARGPAGAGPPGAPAGAGAAEAPAPAPRSARPRFGGWAPTWLLVSLLAVAMALRFGLNAFDSNVIDVGYAGVIGADRIAHGATPYGTFPADQCGTCDTYGPLNYLTYVPFELVQPWEGTWDDLPAAHGAASFFDLLCIGGLAVLGWRLSGLRLAVALALAWAAFPFSAYALESNANDALVAAVLIWGLVVASHPLWRGVLLGLALATKFAPAVLLPLWSRRPFPRPDGRRNLLPYLGGLALAVVLVGWVLFLDGLDGVRAFWDRTLGYQLGRDSPFSIWGQHPDLRPVQIALMVVVGVAALAVLRWPRRLDMLTLAALSGALMIGLELTVTHWFYLYIPWFLPFALIAMVPDWPARPRPAADRPGPERAPAQAPVEVTA